MQILRDVSNPVFIYIIIHIKTRIFIKISETINDHLFCSSANPTVQCRRHYKQDLM